jgi:hypothetical protein
VNRDKYIMQNNFVSNRLINVNKEMHIVRFSLRVTYRNYLYADHAFPFLCSSVI